jgi:group II intron reverse transcriptase/maturase
MRSPEVILKNLELKTKEKTYRFERLYRNLYNPELYLLAYQKIASSEGSMTAGTDGETLDGMSMARINRIIETLKDHSYQPQPVRRTYIAKKNSSKKRPLGIPSTDDKLVQEVVRMLLEAIYEPNFSDKSHGFRPNRSCHTCLGQIKRLYTGTKWFVEGDIRGCFDNIDHHILINIIRKRIKDENFIELLWKFLRAGYLEKWEYNTTYSGAPQGSGVSPILANIYLNELDVFMENLKKDFDRQNSYRKPQKAYSQTLGLIAYWKKKLKSAKVENNEAEVEKATARIKELYAKLRVTPCYEAIDESFKKIQYTRYADDFVIGVIGSKADAEEIKRRVGDFLKGELNLIMSDEKTKITHSAELIRFLGYDLSVSRSKDCMRDKNGNLKRAWYGQVKLYVPKEKWFNKLLEYKAMYIKKCKNGKELWKPTYRGKFINMPDAQIVSQFNAEIRGIYNYYRLAINVSVLDKFYRIMKASLYKTFGCKYRTTYKHICERYKRNGEFIVKYKTQSGTKEIMFYHDGFRMNMKPAPDFADIMPTYRKYTKKNSLIHRLQAGYCELCGKQTDEVIMHHVRKLKELKGTTEWERKMIEIRRKSLAVCPECFKEIKNQV